ncbi:MAG: histidine--tRNA ligase [Candidatus Micrarchaeota archaeon]
MTEKFQTVRGMRDFLPDQMRVKQSIEDTCRNVFESFGFEPLQTPIVEDFGLLAKKGSGGEAIKNEIYYFKDKSDRELGLRFDLTVPLGRVIASNSTLPKPFKRYQIGTVYRYDRPQAGRYREFTQCDVDIIGAAGILADFECLQIGCKVMQELQIDYWVVLNSRPLLEELAFSCGVPKEKIADCFRSIDKLDKIGEKEVEEELKQCGIGKKILGVLKEKDLKKIKAVLKNKKPMEEMEKLLELVKQNNLTEAVKLDLSLARGLEYYTGFVFEIKTKQGPSVGGGGRYDKLVELYGGQATPATGISFGVDRLLDVLEKQNKKVPPKSRVLVMAFTEKQSALALKAADAFRQAGINAEFDLLSRNVSKNSEYCQKKGIRFLAIIGENEEKKGTVTVKDLQKKGQFDLPNSLVGLSKLLEMMG